MSLRNLALANGKFLKVQPWHVRLERLIPYTAVFYIFLDAELEGNVMFFDNVEDLERANKYKNDVLSILPRVSMVSRTQVLPYDVRQERGADSRDNSKHRG